MKKTTGTSAVAPPSGLSKVLDDINLACRRVKTANTLALTAHSPAIPFAACLPHWASHPRRPSILQHPY